MKSNRLIVFYLYSLVFLCANIKNALASNVIELDENTWHELLTGEWLVHFYAPWCPACKSLKDVWNEVGNFPHKTKIAKIDVTTSPALSGRFLVTALPTIYHVNNGEFRLYRGSRDYTSFTGYLENKKWANVEPVSWWTQPNSIQMTIVANFFKLSHYLKEVNNYMAKEYGMPIWIAYCIFAAVTVLLGAALGLLFVFIADCVFALRDTKKVDRKERKSFTRAQDSKQVDNIATEDLEETSEREDDNVESGVEGRDSEDNNDDDENRSESETKSQRSPNIRKRRPKKE